MRSFQVIALLLWGFIFIVAAFVLGQFFASRDIFDITEMVMGKEDSKENSSTDVDDTLSNEIIKDKIGQETVRVGRNIADEYFTNYYREYVNYIMSNNDSYPINQKTTINDTLASDYVFYAVSNNIDNDKYKSEEDIYTISIAEASINSFVDDLFGKEIDEAYKKDGKNGYDKASKKYSIEKNNTQKECTQQLQEIENITSNELVLTYSCKQMDEENSRIKSKNTIRLTIVYKGGRYIVTEVQKEN